MSSQSFARYPSTSHSRNRIYATDSYQKSAKPYYTPHEPPMVLSSSPIRSSSPPMTPYSIRHTRSDALVRSSPEIASDTLFHGVREHMEDPSSMCGLRYSSNRYPERAYTPLKHDSFSNHSYTPLSDFDVSEYSEDVDHDIQADSEHTSDSAPGRNSVFFSDTEEENDEFSFGHDGYRTTFFRTSAERGQWKSHPIPFKSTPLSQAQRSASILSRPPTPVLLGSSKNNSEPAPSTVTGPGLYVEPDQHNNLHADGLCPVSFENVEESELQPVAESPHPMLSLTSDWESIPDIDTDGHGYERPLSPLPPSSPISYSMSILSRSVSPTSFSVVRSSSPLSEISSLDQEDGHADKLESAHIRHPDCELKIQPSILTSTFDLNARNKSGNALDGGLAIATTGTTLSLNSDSAPLSIDAAVNPDLPSSSSVPTAQTPDHGTELSLNSLIAGHEADITSEATDAVPRDSSVVNRPADSMDTHPERCDSVQEIQHVSIPEMQVEDDNIKKLAARRKRRKGNVDDDEHLILKKRKVDVKFSRVADLLRPMTHSSVCNERKGVRAEKNEENHDQQVFAKPKRRRKGEVEVEVSCSAPTTKRSKTRRPPLPKTSSRSPMSRLDRNDGHKLASLPSAQDFEAATLNAEICGMLIETMALSRASSLPLSSLYKLVMQTQPSLRSQRSEQEWLTVFALVLQEGEAGKGSGVFGKVESSGKDDSNRPLEAQWFYVPEQDQDQERAALIRSMMPRPAKRTETKKYKQYYWRPLDEISKWDPEDEL